jgi:hypothetical protein
MVLQKDKIDIELLKSFVHILKKFDIVFINNEIDKSSINKNIKKVDKQTINKTFKRIPTHAQQLKKK